ncbi:MAG: hypothetical protein OIF50_09900 [Flavobacteriaceae bacterium]|nr:hypothetical protein [Flavobacteriaceae bacterium]
MLRNRSFIVVILVSVLSFGGCEPNKNSQELGPKQTTTLKLGVVKNLPKVLLLNVEVEKELKDWNAFKQLEDSFNTLYKVQDIASLKVFLEDMIQKEIALHTKDFPSNLNLPSVKSRIKVLKTLLLKIKNDTKDATIDEKVYDTNLKELVGAYNALRKQIDEVIIYKISENMDAYLQDSIPTSSEILE